jgi:hypothetical protein
MDDIKKSIQNNIEERKNNIMKGFAGYDDLEKGRKSAPIGTISGSYKKVDKDKWEPVKKPKKGSKFKVGKSEFTVSEIDGSIMTVADSKGNTKKFNSKVLYENKIEFTNPEPRKAPGTSKPKEPWYMNPNSKESKKQEKQEEFKDLLEQKRQLDSDMNQEAGELGDAWTDAHANEYGGKLGELDDKIDAMKKKHKYLNN